MLGITIWAFIFFLYTIINGEANCLIYTKIFKKLGFKIFLLKPNFSLVKEESILSPLPTSNTIYMSGQVFRLHEPCPPREHYEGLHYRLYPGLGHLLPRRAGPEYEDPHHCRASCARPGAL